MGTLEILKLRLSNTGLSTSPFKTAAEAVAHLGAVQAQDFSAAKWALGLRIKNSTNDRIEKAFNKGSILRTHVMRPTLHFVMPEDIRWMSALSAPRVKAILAPYNRQLHLDNKLFSKSNRLIVKALEGHKHLTRQELKTVLANKGIDTNVQRLAHIIIWAELEGLICSGPRREKQFTYALVEERAPKAKLFSRGHSLAKLALKYFESHGPAQTKDFSWWCGLSVKDAREVIDLRSNLKQQEVGGKTYWFSSKAKTKPISSALLLSIYDEYTIAYKDRGLMCYGHNERLMQMGNALTSVIILDGMVAGTWKKVSRKDGAEIALNPFRKLGAREKDALEAQVERYGKFFGMPAVLTFSSK